MARTYRKKRSDWEFNKWHSYDYVKVVSQYGGTYYQDIPLKRGSPEYKKAWKRFHSEKYANGVPSWFCNLYFQRAMRRKTKNLLNSWQEETNFPMFKKTAAWDWY